MDSLGGSGAGAVVDRRYFADCMAVDSVADDDEIVGVPLQCGNTLACA